MLRRGRVLLLLLLWLLAGGVWGVSASVRILQKTHRAPTFVGSASSEPRSPQASVEVDGAQESGARRWVSVLGDAGMRSNYPKTQFCGWNFCNGARAPVAFPSTPSPRMADCATSDNRSGYANAVSVADNALGVGTQIPHGYNG